MLLLPYFTAYSVCITEGTSLDVSWLNHTHVIRLLSSLFFTGGSQLCYSQAGCVGDIVTVPGPTARECCVGTDDGESYSENDVHCTISQCIGMYSIHDYCV